MRFDFLDDRRDERVFHGTLAKNVVGRDAGLPAVEIFAENDALGGEFEICRRVNDAGAFPSELQNGGSQMLRRAAQNFFADGLASREENEIEFLLKERGVFGSAAGNDGNVFGRERFRDEFFDDFARCRRIRAGLYNRSVPGGDRIDERSQRQKKRIIPRTHNQHVPVRNGLLETAGSKLRKRSPNRFSFRKALNVTEHIRNLGQHHANFAHEAFIAAFPEVGGQRVADFVFIFFNDGVELFELRNAERHRNRCSGFEKTFLFFK